ncbi:MAG: sodium:calcium antiporter [Candidatus Bathyarchaeota archaeon]|nr:MAG: sodium:calcium antiporter [Candidatus Bathyarchaeota archaeon]
MIVSSPADNRKGFFVRVGFGVITKQQISEGLKGIQGCKRKEFRPSKQLEICLPFITNDKANVKGIMVGPSNSCRCSRMNLYSLPLLAISLFLIGIVSDRIIRYTLALSRAFGLSEIAAGFILLSVTTSLPELSVSTIASLADQGGLSVGNVLGSNVANLTIIIGLAVFFSRTEILIKGQSQKELVQFLFLSSIIPLFIVQRGSLGPILGLVLLILFVYFSVTISRKTEKTKPLGHAAKSTAIVGLKFIVCLVVIISLSKLVVDSSVDIAQSVGLPPSIIGATIVALGTSLPELATTIQALKKKFFEMALGNLLGSCITNITLILGVSSLISFSEVSVLAVESIMFYVLLSSLSVWYMISSSEIISKKGAFFLLVVYIIFVLQQTGISIFVI